MRRGINLDLALCYSCFHVNFLAEEQRLVRSLKLVDTCGGSVVNLKISDQKPLAGETPPPSSPSSLSSIFRGPVRDHQLGRGRRKNVQPGTPCDSHITV